MALSDPERPSILQFDPERRKPNDPNLAQIMRDIVSNVKDLERKNKELEERNAELLAALAQVNEQVAHLERSTKNVEGTNIAFNAAVQMLGNAESAIQSIQHASRAENAIRYEAAVKRALELHQEAVAVLEEAHETTTIRTQEADRKALEIIREAERAILSLVDALENPSPDQPAQFVDLMPTPSVEDVGEAAPEALQKGELIELVAAPFRSFATLSEFQAAVRQLPGVANVTPRRFDEKGTLYLTIHYADAMPLPGRLTQLSQFNLRLSSITEDRIEIIILS